MDLLTPPPLVNSRFRLQGKVRRYGPLAVYEALDQKRDPAPVLLWMLPAQGPQALRLAVTLESLQEHELPELLELRATGQVVSGRGADLAYLATERPELDLLEAVRNGPLTGADLHELAQHLAEAVLALHRTRLGHGALHPGMVFRCGPRWKLGGVGLVASGLPALLSFGRRPPLTGFVSPEALTGRGVRKADAWGLGALVLWAGTGVAPFEGDLDQVLTDLAMGLVPSIGRMPQPLDLLVAGCLLRDQERRWTAERALATLRGEPHAGLSQSHHGFVRPRSVRAWPAATARRLALHSGRVTALAWQRDTLLSGDATGQVRLTNTSGSPLQSWQLEGRVSAVLFHGQHFYAASAGGQLLIGSPQESHVEELEAPLRALRWREGLEGITSFGGHVGLRPGDEAVTPLEAPPLLWCWASAGDLAATLDGTLLRPDHPPTAAESEAAVLAVQLTPGGPAIGTGDGRVVCGSQFWDNGESAAVLALAVEPSVQTSVACAKADRTVHLLHLPDLQATHCLQAPATCLAFSPDGHWLAVGLLDGAIGLWPVPPLSH